MSTRTEYHRETLLERIAHRLRATARYDAFPAFSARVRRALYNPFGVLLLAALTALICGFFLHAQGFVLGGGVTVVLLLGVLWPWLSLRGLIGSIAFERARAVEGETVEVSLTLTNKLFWSALGLVVRGGFARQEQDEAPIVSIAAAPARRTARCRWSFVPDSRGRYPLAAPRLASGFPFGLWENSRPAAAAAPLIVWPRTLAVGPVPLLSGDQPVEGNVTRNQVGTSGDVLGVRPYRRGDSPRRIHWAQSARHDRLIVCELQANARPVLQLVLDTDPRRHCGQGPDSSREWAIRIAASLAKGWLAAGAQVGAVWQGEVFAPASGLAQTQRLLDSLACLPDAAGPTLIDTLNTSACRQWREGLQIIIASDVAFQQATPSDLQRWIVLQSSAFGGTRAALSGRPWLLIDAIEHIPALLRGGWQEAQHGS